MSTRKPIHTNIVKLLTLLADLNNAQVLALLPLIGRGLRYFLAATIDVGMYEVLDFASDLELHDTKGKNATYHKREAIRFLQDNIIAYEDQAFGHGDIFADYQCSPGFPVDRYEEGNHYRILISLRETKQRGETEVFQIERDIRGGFTQPVEFFQIRVEHRTRRFAMSVTFPRKRVPLEVALVEHNAKRSTPLGAAHVHRLPDGRQRFTWQTRNPRRLETYGLRWQW
jgi:hypothetical protein